MKMKEEDGELLNGFQHDDINGNTEYDGEDSVLNLPFRRQMADVRLSRDEDLAQTTQRCESTRKVVQNSAPF